MRSLFRSLFSRSRTSEDNIRHISARRRGLSSASDDVLRGTYKRSKTVIDTIAVTAVIASRILGLSMFDVQLQGAVALADGKVAEMQTGEGKTLAAVPAIVWYARQGRGVHVMTANDYLARRDAQWMAPIYEFLGLTVACIQQGMSAAQRRQAYACDITYGTANEIAFDYLRDQLALDVEEQVHRPFATAVVDEADSILIDEARLPLVIAGEDEQGQVLAYRVDGVTRHFQRNVHYTIDDHQRNVVLTDAGVCAIEEAFECRNLFDEENLALHAAVQDSLHAHALLRRDVDYVVKDGAIQSVDEFKGRIIQERRWPAGLHTAIEARENVVLKKQGKVLASVTVQNFIALYPVVCGMTGTAATQAEEFQAVYGLEVEVIPTNRPMIRVDHPDIVFPTRSEKEAAVVAEIRRIHQPGQPILVGSASVEESERLSAQLQDVPHQVLNARDDAHEAVIIARAGEPGAVTISTNMAGRGTDIRLGEGVAQLGGLYIIGTTRHESRRIDHQLRGRAGRQGDPGCSRFFVSLEDPLLVKYGINNPAYQQDHEMVQRAIEGQQLDIRLFLTKYERVTEGRRLAIRQRREEILTGAIFSSSDHERRVRLATIDDLWCEYLSALAEVRSGVQWVSLAGGGRDPLQEYWRFGGFDPFREYIRQVDVLFQELLAGIEIETARRINAADGRDPQATTRSATWTYITTDQPFGTWVQNALRDYLRRRMGSADGAT